MKLATLADGTLDGQLIVVSSDGARAITARDIAPSLLAALQAWSSSAPLLRELAMQLDNDAVAGAFAFDAMRCAAPLPRSPQWCDGSAFLNHSRLMQIAFDKPPIPDIDKIPLMYQGASDDFLGPHDDVPMADVALGIDFEGEFGVVVDAVPMGVSPEAALRHIRLIVQINDWSLRALAPREMTTGFGFLQAKPSTSFAPIAVTPDELGESWREGRVQMRLHVDYNSKWFGHPHGGAMNFHFGELIAYAARTRKLSAGTVIGSGTVSNADPSAGSSCIAERRAIEKIQQGASITPFMRFGDRVRIQARLQDGRPGPFGVIDQCVVNGRQEIVE